MPRRLRVRFAGIYTLSALGGSFALTGKAATTTYASGASDFSTRKANSFRSFAFDVPGDLGINKNGLALGYTATTSYGWQNLAGEGGVTPVIASDTTPIGSGSVLKMTHVAGNDGADSAGHWETRFSDDDSLTIGANQTLYFQFRYKQDGAFTQSSPENPEGVKLLFIDCSGDTASGSSATPITIIFQTQGQANPRFNVYFYSQVTANGATAGQTFRLVAPDFTGNVPNVPSFPIPTNEWVTFTGVLQLGAVMTASPYNGLHIDGSLTIDMIDSTGVKTRVCQYGPGWHNAYDATDYIGFPWRDRNSPSTAWIFGKWMFLPYTTGRNGVSVGQDWHFWYDELILSQNAIPDPAATNPYPAWRSALTLNALTNITTDSSTAHTAHIAAGYSLPAWYDGNQIFDAQNLLAWGSGIIAPKLGRYGAMLFMSNGHEADPASCIHRFDLETAKWVAPIGVPQVHRQVSPNYTAPPADAELWYDPDNASGKTNIATWNYTTTTSTYYPVGTVLSGETAVNVAYRESGTTWPNGFHSGAFSFAYFPPLYGWRYNTNVGSTGMRYDSLAVVPVEGGGEAAGTLVALAVPIPHSWNGTSYDLGWLEQFGTNRGGGSYAWRFGLTTGAWISHSTDQISSYASRGAAVSCAYSRKQGKVVVGGGSFGTPMLGYYDVATNSHGYYNSYSYPYSIGAPYTPGGGVPGTDCSCAIVTDGHDYNLWIALGSSAPTYGNDSLGLFVFDLDECAANPLQNPPPTGANPPWMILPPGATDLTTSPHARKVGLLGGIGAFAIPPTSNWSGVYGYSPLQGAVMWSQARKKLFIWIKPWALADAASRSIPTPNLSPNGYGYAAPLPPNGTYNLFMVDIPTGSTNGVPNYQTQTWTVTPVPLTLAAGTPGINVGQTAGCYARIAYSDELDCVILAENPVDMAVQAVKVF